MRQGRRRCRSRTLALRKIIWPRSTPDIARGHIGSRDDLLEGLRPATHGRKSSVRARSIAFLQFIWHGNRHSRGLQGIFARAMAPICVHRARRTPPDIALRHIRSRDGLPEALRTATHGRTGPLSPFPAIHLARQSPFYGPPGHIDSRDDLKEGLRTATHGRQRSVRARSLAFLQFIWHGNRHSTGLQGTSARAMASICVHRASRTPPDIAPRHIGSRDGLQEEPRPSTHGRQSPVSARSHAFLQFICHGNRHSRDLQGISARAMASICVHRASRTPPDIATRHIGSRDD